MGEERRWERKKRGYLQWPRTWAMTCAVASWEWYPAFGPGRPFAGSNSRPGYRSSRSQRASSAVNRSSRGRYVDVSALLEPKISGNNTEKQTATQRARLGYTQAYVGDSKVNKYNGMPHKQPRPTQCYPLRFAYRVWWGEKTMTQSLSRNKRTNKRNWLIIQSKCNSKVQKILFCLRWLRRVYGL